MENKPFSVLLIDDHDIVLQGLKAHIEQVFGQASVFEATSRAKAFEVLSKNSIQIVITDLSIDGFLSEMELPEKLIEIDPKLQIIVFSMHSEASVIKALYNKGIAGYITKASPLEDIIKAIHAILSGSKYFDAHATTVIGEENEEATDTVLFTNREKQIIKMISQGYNTDKIAKKLRISPNTVETHRKNIFHKSGKKNMASLVKFALIHGILES